MHERRANLVHERSFSNPRGKGAKGGENVHREHVDVMHEHPEFVLHAAPEHVVGHGDEIGYEMPARSAHDL